MVIASHDQFNNLMKFSTLEIDFCAVQIDQLIPLSS